MPNALTKVTGNVIDSTTNITIGIGSTSGPSLSPNGDSNTGIFFPSADTIAFSEGGTEAMRIDSSGRLGIGVTTVDAGKLHILNGGDASFTANTTFDALVVENGTSAQGAVIQIVAATNGVSEIGFSDSTRNVGQITYDHSSDVLFVKTAGVERCRVDGSGRLLVGTTSARVIEPYGLGTDGQSANTYESVGDTNPGPGLALCSNSTTSRMGPYLYFCRSNAASVGSNTLTTSGDNLGTISFAGADGTDVRTRGAAIYCEVDGTPGANDMPGRLVFSTTADGAATPTERLRLDSAGSMVLASGTAFVAPYVYNVTTATAANVNVDASGFLRRSTSSIKYKANVETIQDQYADAILGCRPVWYQSTCEADKPDWGHWGFIAEEVAAIDPRLCFFKEEKDGTLEPEGVQYDRFVPHLLNLIKRQQQAIETLEAKVAVLESA